MGCRKGPDGWGASDPVGTACWADQLELKAQTLPCRLAAPEPGRARQRRPGPVSDLSDEAADPSTRQGLSRGQSAAWCLAGSGLRHGCPSASILLPAIGVQGQRRGPPSAGLAPSLRALCRYSHAVLRTGVKLWISASSPSWAVLTFIPIHRGESRGRMSLADVPEVSSCGGWAFPQDSALRAGWGLGPGMLGTAPQ